jgi:CrcB protein
MSSLIWYVALGSAAGGVARYLVSAAIQSRVATSFPAGTLVVNITGSLAIGIVLRYALGSPEVGPEMRMLLVTGFLGGYTTFSAFSYETLALAERGEYVLAGAYVIASVVLSLLGTFSGMAIGDAMLRARGS